MTYIDDSAATAARPHEAEAAPEIWTAARWQEKFIDASIMADALCAQLGRLGDRQRHLGRGTDAAPSRH
jgi:hypothetical protein